MYDVLVIGGGPAGVTAALRAAELGASVALLERDRMGGTCTNDGCVPTRVLAKAARLLRETRQFDRYGLAAAEPELDFSRLLARTQQVVYTIHEKKQLIHLLQEAGVQVYAQAGTASFVDAHTVQLADGRSFQGEKIILCAGGHARRLDFPGAEHALTHQEVWSLKSLPKSLIVVGAAATGSQLASIFATFGTKIYLLEVAPRILRVEDEDVSAAIAHSFAEQGIQVITGIGGIERIERPGKGYSLSYRQGESIHTLEAEAVILSSGWLGNVAPLNLAAAGVASERNYVIVDDYLRTSAPHIFAAGDINGRMMLVQSAGYEARVAAENAVLGVGQVQRHQIVPHGGFTDPEYASVGLTQAQAQAQEECVVSVVPYAHLDRAVIDGHPVGFCKLIVSKENHRLLGAHIVGEQALESIQLVAAGMAAEMWVEQLAELELAYPTYTAAIGLAARQALRELGVMPLAPVWRALGKPHAEWERGSFSDW